MRYAQKRGEPGRNPLGRPRGKTFSEKMRAVLAEECPEDLREQVAKFLGLTPDDVRGMTTEEALMRGAREARGARRDPREGPRGVARDRRPARPEAAARGAQRPGRIALRAATIAAAWRTPRRRRCTARCSTPPGPGFPLLASEFLSCRDCHEIFLRPSGSRCSLPRAAGVCGEGRWKRRPRSTAPCLRPLAGSADALRAFSGVRFRKISPTDTRTSDHGV